MFIYRKLSGYQDESSFCDSFQNHTFDGISSMQILGIPGNDDAMHRISS